MKSGMVAAKTVFSALAQNKIGKTLHYKKNLQKNLALERDLFCACFALPLIKAVGLGLRILLWMAFY